MTEICEEAMHEGEVDRIAKLIESAAARGPSEAQLNNILEHVAQAGFDSQARERVRGRLAGTVWQGRELIGSDMLTPAEVHYLWHVVRRREWPLGTTLEGYQDSLRTVVLDEASGVFVGRYQGVWQAGVVRESRELCGPDGQQWVVVQYRAGWGHWVTGYQPEAGLSELTKPQWSEVSWLRVPKRSSGQ